MSARALVEATIAAVMCLFLSPLLLALSLAVAASVGSPVLFRQLRSGKDGIPFELTKFRTMTDEIDINGNLLPDDSRMTAVGKFMRKYSLDELPSLLNIVRGEMTFVGPRPLLPEYLEYYSPSQRKRLLVKPGLTGWAQVNGRNDLSWDEKFELDRWYVENRSVSIDFKVLMRTVKVVLSGAGVASSGHATTTRFDVQVGLAHLEESQN